MKENAPLISVIIPVFNSEKYINKAVDSVLNQSYKNLEIILVNDGSTDKSPEICNQYSKEYNNIQTYHKENGGAGSARNLALEKKLGKFVVFLDSDDYLEKNAIYNLYNGYLNSLSDAIIPNKYYFINKDKTTIRNHFITTDFTNNPIEFILSIMIKKGRSWRSTSVLYKSEIITLNNIRYPEGFIMEDFFFNIDYFEKCNQISQLSTPTLFNQRRYNSASNSFDINLIDIYLKIDDKIEIFLKTHNLASEKNILIQKQLLLRNYIIYIKDLILSNVYSYKIICSIIEKYQKNDRIINCLTAEKIEAYYNNPLSIFYLKIAHKLIKYKKYRLLYFSTKLINIF